MMYKSLALFLFGLSCEIAFAAAPQNIDGFTSIMSALNNPGSFSVLVGELQSSKTAMLLDKINTKEKMTLLAPTDKALNDFGQIGALRGTPLLEQFLKHHMIEGLKDRKWLRSHRTAQMLSGKQINLKNIGKIAYTIETDNGIIHVINKVVLHPDVRKKLGIKDS